MAGSATIVASILLLVACMCCIFPTDSVTIPSSCCMSFISKKIPENRVVSYQLANGSICPKAGVISDIDHICIAISNIILERQNLLCLTGEPRNNFITKKGHKICTDPKLLWVQRYIQNLDAKKNQPSEGAKAVGAKFAIQRHRGNSTKV